METSNLFGHKKRITMRFYLYPNSARAGSTVYNPYTDNFISAMEKKHVCVNKNSPSNSGVFHMFSYFFRTDVFILNWIEDLADKKGGAVQCAFFLMFMRVARLFGKRFLWVVHNQLSHKKTNMHLKKRFTLKMAKLSRYKLTHANQGIDYLKNIGAIKSEKEVLCIPHPVHKIKSIPNQESKYDILIWGTMAEYKGVDLFLQYLQENSIDDISVLVAGKVPNNEYRTKLLSFNSKTIEIVAGFIDDASLESYFAQSRAVAFTYQKSSVLSSGALMDTIGYLKPVVGPKTGAFKDLSDNNLVFTYDTFSELIELTRRFKQNGIPFNPEEARKFCELNDWSNFQVKLDQYIEWEPK